MKLFYHYGVHLGSVNPELRPPIIGPHFIPPPFHLSSLSSYPTISTTMSSPQSPDHHRTHNPTHRTTADIFLTTATATSTDHPRPIFDLHANDHHLMNPHYPTPPPAAITTRVHHGLITHHHSITPLSSRT
ncbi:hypothetical protein RND81_14G186200 [Saponaria officinalis]|uniref:Uncharacterized protein n=1 Tax=Saponaria officinalis TaxID=3572 RepID=A0AAW1GRZ0_SAPOF